MPRYGIQGLPLTTLLVTSTPTVVKCQVYRTGSAEPSRRQLARDNLFKRGAKLPGCVTQGRPGDPDGGLPWTNLEDHLLCSIVHEFGVNWRLVADVFATSSAMAGIFRSPLQCRWRFKELAVRPMLCKADIAGATCRFIFVIE